MFRTTALNVALEGRYALRIDCRRAKVRRDIKLPMKCAFFCEDDARFAMVDGVRLPVVFVEKESGDGKYKEFLNEFDGRREEFVSLADRMKLAVKVRDLGEDWDMIGVYQISGVQTYGEPFECLIGKRTARLKEIEAPT